MLTRFLCKLGPRMRAAPPPQRRPRQRRNHRHSDAGRWLPSSGTNRQAEHLPRGVHEAVECQVRGLHGTKALPEHVRPVVFQVRTLFARELTDLHALIDSPGIKQLLSNLGNDDQFLAAGERYVTLVEEVIDVW